MKKKHRNPKKYNRLKVRVYYKMMEESTEDFPVYRRKIAFYSTTEIAINPRIHHNPYMVTFNVW